MLMKLRAIADVDGRAPSACRQCCRVGAALGAGQALSARLAARASLLAVPIVWVVVAALLLEPDSQKGILWLFTKVGLQATAKT